MPQTYMNRSGISVAQAVRFYRVPTEELLVVCDDMNLPFGQCRLKPAGTAGGQKGLQDILQHMGTNDVPRLRIGVGRPPANFDAADYVLGRFSKTEQAQLEEITSRAADAIETWTRNGIDLAMSRTNGPQPS